MRSTSSRIVIAIGIAALAVILCFGLMTSKSPSVHAAVVPQHTGSIHPVSCGADPDFMMTYNNGHVYCVAGAGYWSSGDAGVSGWFNVTRIVGFHCSLGWVRAYKNGSGSYPDWSDSGVYSGVQPPYSDLTQIDITSIGC
jgi:hypothetical protein